MSTTKVDGGWLGEAYRDDGRKVAVFVPAKDEPWALPCTRADHCNGELAKAFDEGTMSRSELAHALAHAHGQIYRLEQQRTSLLAAVRAFLECAGIPPTRAFQKAHKLALAAFRLAEYGK